MLDSEILLFLILLAISISFIFVFVIIIYSKLKKILIAYDNLQKNFNDNMNKLAIKLDSFYIEQAVEKNLSTNTSSLPNSCLFSKSHLPEQQSGFTEVESAHGTYKKDSEKPTTISNSFKGPQIPQILMDINNMPIKKIKDDADNNSKLRDSITLDTENDVKIRRDLLGDSYSENDSLKELNSLESEILDALKRLGDLKSSTNSIENEEN